VIPVVREKRGIRVRKVTRATKEKKENQDVRVREGKEAREENVERRVTMDVKGSPV
jgi:hypothetical protein